MKCPPETELNEFAENRLDSRRRWEIQEHLDQCTGCRTDLEGLQWVCEPLALLDLLVEAEAMDHPSEADLAALAEGSLDADRKAELLSHIGLCAECARLYGELPRPQRKSVIPRNLYSFAAAAALLLCIGLFAFTGKFADHKHPATSVVAQHTGGKAEPQKFASKPPKASSKPAEMVAAKPVAPVKTTEPVKPVVAAKPLPTPVAPAKVSPPVPTPTVVAQATPNLAAASAVRRNVSSSRKGGRTLTASRAHRVRSGRAGHSDHYNNMQVAMATQQDMARAFHSDATHDKAIATSPSSPSPAKVTVPGAPLAASVGSPGAPGGFHTQSVAASPGPGDSSGEGLRQVSHKSQTLPLTLAKSRNDPAEKTQLKKTGHRLSTGKLSGQKAEAEVSTNKTAKASLKSLTAKSAHHHSSHSRTKVAHHHGAHHTTRVAHAQPTGAQAHPGPHHA